MSDDKNMKLNDEQMEQTAGGAGANETFICEGILASERDRTGLQVGGAYMVNGDDGNTYRAITGYNVNFKPGERVKIYRDSSGQYRFQPIGSRMYAV